MSREVKTCENLEYAVSISLLGDEDVSLLNSEFIRAFGDPKSNKIHSNVVQLGAEQIESSHILSRVLVQITAYFTDVLKVSGIVLNKVWFVKSGPKDTNPNKLPYLPHFDKQRYLKAMIYLHDVLEDHGPIHFGMLSNPSEIDIRRKGLPSNYQELGLNTIKSCELKSGMKPILGQKGDVIFFDTNAAHCAGIVRKGFERRVIRFDFDVRGFNEKKSFIKRLVGAISSRLR